MQAIYKITNKHNGKFYIGSTNCIKKRWRNHLCKLRQGKHENSYLQQAWDKYGETAFEFSIVEEVMNNNRIEREIYYLNETKCYDRNIGYNFDRNPTDKSGANNSFYGKEHSDETKQKLREHASNRSDDLKRRMGEKNKGEGSAKAVLNWEKVREIRKKYVPIKYSCRMLAEEYGVKTQTIQAVIKRHTWIEDE